MIGAIAGGASVARAEDDNIPHLQSGGSSSSDDEDNLRSRRERGDGARGRNGQHGNETAAPQLFTDQSFEFPSTSQPLDDSKTLTNEVMTAMYTSPPRSEYHRRVEENRVIRMGSILVPHSIMPNGWANRQGAEASGDKLLPPVFRDGPVFELRDLVYGALTKYDDIGLDTIHKGWRIANVWIARISTLMIIASLASLCCSTVASLNESHSHVFFAIEAATVTMLGLDYLIRFICTRERAHCFVTNSWNIVDVLSILPFFADVVFGRSFKGLGVLRAVRLVHTFRLARGSRNQGMDELFRAMRKSESALSLLSFLLLITMFIFSSLLYLLDQTEGSFDETTNTWIQNDGVRSPFQSIFHTMWFCITTLATVGYGDDVPFSILGQLISACIMIAGILVIAFPTVILSASFHEAYNERYLSMLKKGLLEKQKESLAYGRNRRMISKILTRNRTSVFDATVAESNAGLGGEKPNSFRGRVMSILRRHSTAFGKDGDNPASENTEAQRMKRWSTLKEISDQKDLERLNSTNSDETATTPTTTISTTASRVSLKSVAKRLAPSTNNNPNPAPTQTVPRKPQTLAERALHECKPINAVEKRFAPPEVTRLKMVLVPFQWILKGMRRGEGGDTSEVGPKSCTAPQADEGRRPRSVVFTGPNADDSEEGSQRDDSYGTVKSQLRSVGRRHSSITAAQAQVIQKKTDEHRRSLLGQEEAFFDDSDEDNDDKQRSSISPARAGRDNDTHSSKSIATISSMKINGNRLKFACEEEIQKSLQDASERLNLNVIQLTGQTITSNGVVHYPPKLKLLCIGGTDTISTKVEPCFPPGSSTVTFTVVIDDEEYSKVQKKLAQLTYGGGIVRAVATAPIFKLKVELKLDSIAAYEKRLQALRGEPPAPPKTALLDESELLQKYMTSVERTLLDSCYLTTTCFRDVISSTIDVVVMCPTPSAFKVFQRFMHLLKFSFIAVFREPQQNRFPMNALATDKIFLDAHDGTRLICPQRGDSEERPVTRGIDMSDAQVPLHHVDINSDVMSTDLLSEQPSVGVGYFGSRAAQTSSMTIQQDAIHQEEPQVPNEQCGLENPLNVVREIGSHSLFSSGEEHFSSRSHPSGDHRRMDEGLEIETLQSM